MNNTFNNTTPDGIMIEALTRIMALLEGTKGKAAVAYSLASDALVAVAACEVRGA